MKSPTIEKERTHKMVREQYGRVARQGGGCGGGGCCGAGGSGLDSEAVARRIGYSAEEAGSVPEGANLGLGCGNPQAIAALRAGETVLDLGSGAGFDAFLAARAVGPAGKVIGVDMTPEMIEKARRNLGSGGFPAVEFRLGEIENLPVADSSVDVVISNCVINLSPDKPRVFREAFRVLREGGRLAISDVVALAAIPDALRGDWALYTGCVAGASTAAEIRTWLEEAGFSGIRIAPKGGSREIIGDWFPGRRMEEFVGSATIEAVKPAKHP